MTSPDNPQPEQDLLTPHEAFLAMTDFIWQFAQRAGDDLITLIGDTEIEADGGPFDPAAWEDWLTSVAKIREGKPPREADGGPVDPTAFEHWLAREAKTRERKGS
ncbi:hypothetical protein FHU38_001503 [Saccharomonospora amisosensis]|uniref:Uncharacterized protein n=1 Tax=Saccharomonospora amisosensis TaxID=1128677 RepID=A0A7X5UP03_9PSEU|nr:hypothetical protein [Saccharomonospora amisosensis]NIJ11159.1 hypothetical protein [Saccharomonospora amisosensis]